MMIQIENLKKQFGNKLATDIPALQIGEGELLGIVGNNGAGKTTLFRLALDLLRADEGRVLIGGTDVSRSEAWKQTTGAFIDEGFLIDYLTPEEYFLFVGRTYKLDKEEIERRLRSFERLMNGEIVGQRKLIRDYSAGNKQKIGIIAAMLHHPSLLILDEPFNFLDPTSQSVTKHLLSDYCKQHNATVLLSSHNLTHITDICPRILLLEEGRIIRDIPNSDNSANEELQNYFDIRKQESLEDNSIQGRNNKESQEDTHPQGGK